MRRVTGILLALVVVTGCASSSSTTTRLEGTPVMIEVNPAGLWSLSLTGQGEQLTVTMELTRLQSGEFTGSVRHEAFPDIPLGRSALNGNTLVFQVVIPTGDPATITLNFVGNEVDGDWSSSGDGSRITGSRLR